MAEVWFQLGDHFNPNRIIIIEEGAPPLWCSDKTPKCVTANGKNVLIRTCDWYIDGLYLSLKEQRESIKEYDKSNGFSPSIFIGSL